MARLRIEDRVKLSRFGLASRTSWSHEGKVTNIIVSTETGTVFCHVKWDVGYTSYYTFQELDSVEPDINEEELYY